MIFSITSHEFSLLEDRKSYSVIFGGTFDPIHEGHVADIKYLTEHCDRVFLAPTSQNPWKNHYPKSLETRIEMIKLVLNFENIPFNTNIEYVAGVNILNFPYTYSVELLDYIREKGDEKLIWAIGEDLIESSKNWKDWANRGVPFLVLPLLEGFSGTSVRDKKIASHPALENFISTRGLY